MERFQITTKILSGPGALETLRELNIQRLLVVSDPYFSKNGTARQIAQAPQVEIFDEVTPDPTVTLAARGAALVQSFRPDAVLALGGGSAMDCAKAMTYFSGLSPMLIAVPTTSGSGSEVTDFAILTHEGIKHPLVDERLRPHMAILDSTLLQELPAQLVAEGGFDLISHALEAVAATGSGPISRSLAAGAFCTAVELLPASFGGDAGVRLELHTAATMAGMAFSQAGLGVSHGLAHALGGAFHVPHGRLNAILLPAVIDCNAPAAGAAYAQLARLAGISTGTGQMALRALKNALIRLRARLKLPDTLAAAGISPAALEAQRAALVAAALEDPCCATNPVPVTEQLLHRLLWEVQGSD